MRAFIVIVKRSTSPEELRAEERRLGEELGLPVGLSPVGDGERYVVSVRGEEYVCEFDGTYWVDEHGFVLRSVVPEYKGDKE